jgi:hypothetical protein
MRGRSSSNTVKSGIVSSIDIGSSLGRSAVKKLSTPPEKHAATVVGASSLRSAGSAAIDGRRHLGLHDAQTSTMVSAFRRSRSETEASMVTSSPAAIAGSNTVASSASPGVDR